MCEFRARMTSAELIKQKQAGTQLCSSEMAFAKWTNLKNSETRYTICQVLRVLSQCSITHLLFIQVSLPSSPASPARGHVRAHTAQPVFGRIWTVTHFSIVSPQFARMLDIKRSDGNVVRAFM